jgi:undecaprenyl-phosphate 4-deoxy-4-formamido-L-arabinose transferase
MTSMPSPPPTRSISVVIPVFNSDVALPKLIGRLKPVLSEVCDSFEAILVDDGSDSNVWQVIEKLAEANSWIRGIRLMRNFGQHNALLCGVRLARHEFILTIDDDLQHPPEEIPKLLARLDQGFDVVYGTPLAGKHGVWRNIASQMTKVALRDAMGAETATKVSAFRVFRADLRKAFVEYPGPFVSLDVLLTWGTTRFDAVDVRHDVRVDGASHYTVRKLITHALNMMTGFSTVPLQLASLIGFSFTLVGIVALAYVVGRYLIQGTSVPGFPFLASMIAIFSGAQLFALGIIGEYIARIHLRSMERPAYAIRSTTRSDSSPP